MDPITFGSASAIGNVAPLRSGDSIHFCAPPRRPRPAAAHRAASFDRQPNRGAVHPCRGPAAATISD